MNKSTVQSVTDDHGKKETGAPLIKTTGGQTESVEIVGRIRNKVFVGVLDEAGLYH